MDVFIYSCPEQRDISTEWQAVVYVFSCSFVLSLMTFRIDQKVSNNPYGYKLQEAQAILSEVRSIRDAISSGEKEKQELMQVKIHF